MLGAEFLCVVSRVITVHDYTMTPAATRCSSGAGACLLSQHRQVGLHSTLAADGHYYVVTLLLLLLLVEIDNIVVPRPAEPLNKAPGAYNSCLAGPYVLCSLSVCKTKTGTMGVAFIHKKPQYLAR